MVEGLKKVLNYGCGYNVHEDAVNVDIRPCVDGVYEEHDATWKVPNWYERVRLWHVLEHMEGVFAMDLMERLWAVTEPGGICHVRVPFGSSDDAWENPEHVRPWFVGSFQIFGQTYWWREFTNYIGDWQMKEVMLHVKDEHWDEDLEVVYGRVQTLRNVVDEMEVALTCIKPRRLIEKGIKPSEEEFGRVQLVLKRVGEDGDG